MQALPQFSSILVALIMVLVLSVAWHWDVTRSREVRATSVERNAKVANEIQNACPPDGIPGPPADIPAPSEGERDAFLAYYELQFQRASSHETNRLQVSNFVLAGSVVALGLLAGTDTVSKQWPTAVVVSLAVVLINALAIAFGAGARYWFKVHQARASDALWAASPRLHSLQEGVESRFKLGPSSVRNGNFRSDRIVSAMHTVIAVLSALLLAPLWGPM